ncbi:uncharacterized protein LOC143962123 [Lithobates pipiens]
MAEQSFEMQPTAAGSAAEAEKSSETGDPEEFIDTMRRHPELWDKKHCFYANRLKKKAGWNDVAEHHIENWTSLSNKRKAEKIKIIKQRWKTLRDNYKRELVKQQQIRSGSGARKGRIYCHFYELDFLRPVMLERQTDNNFSSESGEEELIPETSTTTEPQPEEYVDDRETPEPPPRRSTKGKTKKNPDNQEFIDLVKKLIDSQKTENSEIAAFAKSLIPQIAEVKREFQCDLRIDILKIIKSYQLKGNPPILHPQPSENLNQPQNIRYGNQWEESGYRPSSYSNACGPNMFMTPQFTPQFNPAPYNMPQTYYPPIQAAPPPPPPPPPTSMPQPNTTREEIHTHTSFYQDL